MLTGSILSNYGGDANCSLLHLLALNNPPDVINEPILETPSYYYDIEHLRNVQPLNRSFSVFSLNIQSIHAKIDQIKIFINELSEINIAFDILCFQETWLSTHSDTSLIQLDGYKLITQSHSSSAHGGLAIYVKINYKYEIYKSITHPLWEGLLVKIYNGSKNIVIGNIYRPPHNLNENFISFFEEFSSLLSEINESNCESVITGDFNINLLKIHSRAISLSFFNLISSAGFIPKINYPTRFNDINNNATLIDNAICKLSLDYSATTSGIMTNKISDHQGYFVTLDFLTNQKQTAKNVTIVKRPENFTDLIKREIIEKDLNGLVQGSQDPNVSYDQLIGVVSEAISKYTEVKTTRFNRRKHKKSPWITFGIIRSIRFKDRLYKRLKLTSPQSPEYSTLKTNFATYNKILKKSIRLAKASYYESIFNLCQGDMRKTWKNINTVMNRNASNEGVPDQIVYEGNTISNEQAILNSLNAHFSSVGQKIAQSIETVPYVSYKDYLTNPTQSRFRFEPVNTETVKDVIKELKNKSSSAVDGLSSKLLKELINELSHPIVEIFNQSISTGIFPNSLKIARVRALFKKGDVKNPTNYRPISILPAISKVFEKIMLKQLTTYFDNNSLLYPGQYGFREKHSTELATLELIDRITTCMEAGQVPFNIYIDLSKAFDCLNHNILLEKLRYYGLENNSLILIKDYLSNRKQFIESGTIRSDCTDIKAGVPQGSILGPFLFLVFINDLNKSSKIFQTINYADDTTLMTTLNAFGNPTSPDDINIELKEITKWLKVNYLMLNADKTKSMFFFHANKRVHFPSLELDGHSIERVESFNYLGITVNQHLSWTPHVNSISNKITKVTGILTKLKHILPQTVLLTIYNSLIACHLSYGILVWGSKIDSIFKLQKKAVRVITLSRRNSHTDPIFLKLGILKIADIRKQSELKFYYKLVQNSLPVYFLHRFITMHNMIHQHHTRQQQNLLLPQFRREYARTSLRYTLANTVNHTPNNIKDKIHTHSFKGFSDYIKRYFLLNYNQTCNVPNCRSCRSSR